MDSNEFKDVLELLTLVKDGNTYVWSKSSIVRAKTEQLGKNNIFSQVGIGAKSIKFTIRKNNSLTLHNAFRWNGKHCFLTDIVEIDRMYYEVTAALVEPKICTIKRTPAPTKNALNRPVYSDPNIITFPGCLIEKYMGHSQGDPMASTEKRYVLVTPKTIEILTGELVTISSNTYTILVPHILDEYKNEYEIIERKDA